jgi:hypothetical protein
LAAQGDAVTFARRRAVIFLAISDFLLSLPFFHRLPRQFVEDFEDLNFEIYHFLKEGSVHSFPPKKPGIKP